MKNKKRVMLVKIICLIVTVLSLIGIITIAVLNKRDKDELEVKYAKIAFKSETIELANQARQYYLKNKFNNVMIISNEENKLDLNNVNIDYYFKLDKEGNIIYLKTSSNLYCIETEKTYIDLTEEDVLEGSCN